MRWPLLGLLFAACTPSQDPLGETLWTLASTDYTTAGAVGAGGHLVRTGSIALELVGPDGTVAWQAPCDGGCGVRQAIDRDGNVYAATTLAMTQTLAMHAAADGALAWSRSLAVPSSLVALDAAGSVWWLVGSQTPVDLGGGPIASSRGHLFGRYAADGTYQASGSLDFFLDVSAPISALPDGGLVGIDSSTRAVVAFDASGRTRWRVDRFVFSYALHEDGELTLVEFIEVDELAGASRYAIVRLDANRSERWRRRGTGDGADITPLAGGAALIAGTDSLAGARSQDASFLERFDANGDSRREIIEADRLLLFAGPVLDSYRFFEPDGIGPEGRVIARRAP